MEGMASERHAPGWAEYASERLAGAGYRRGGARRALVQLLDGQECGLSAPEIEAALSGSDRRVARASVYRVLEELEALDLVSRIEVGDGLARYEAQYPDGARHHHHLVCDSCGELVPFRDEELERAIRRVARRVPFAVNEHDITLRGSCPRCAGAPSGAPR
jgi:Fur family transcriptional regulator, ferric uptake regulator